MSHFIILSAVPDMQRFEFMKQSMLQPSEPMNNLPFINVKLEPTRRSTYRLRLNDSDLIAFLLLSECSLIVL